MGLTVFLHPCEAMQTVSNARPIQVHTEYICTHPTPQGLPELVHH